MSKSSDDGGLKGRAIPSGTEDAATALRRKAENLSLKIEAAAATEALSREAETALSPENTRLMLHELHVHQIELEMQNE